MCHRDASELLLLWLLHHLFPPLLFSSHFRGTLYTILIPILMFPNFYFLCLPVVFFTSIIP